MEWVYCPICKNKTRTKIRKDTELINFPLFCPKCKQESVINVTKQKITVVEPDAKTQSRRTCEMKSQFVGSVFI